MTAHFIEIIIYVMFTFETGEKIKKVQKLLRINSRTNMSEIKVDAFILG